MIRGSWTESYALSWDLAYKSLTDDLWMFNPIIVFDEVNFYLTGYRAIDLIDENPDDRGNYIPNQINKVEIEVIKPITDPILMPIKDSIIDGYKNL